MSFIYPRTIAVHRPNVNTTAGDRGYSGLTRTGEAVVLTGLPASIQRSKKGGTPDAGVPADAYGRTSYEVLIPRTAAALGQIVENDIIVDDLGNRYQVAGAYWNSLGFNLSADFLKP
jgi:hypothetical protein